MKLLDAFSIVLGLYLLINWLPSTNSKSTIVIALVAIGLFYFSAELVGLYRNWQGIAFEKEAATALLAWSSTLVALSVLGQLSIYSTELSSRNLMVWFALTPTLSLAIRIASRWYVSWRQRNSVNTRNYAVVGINDLGLHLVHNVDSTPELGLKFLGYYDDRISDRTVDLPDDASVKLGKLDELIRRGQARRCSGHLHHVANASRRADTRFNSRTDRNNCLGLYRARFVCVPDAQLTLDGHSRSAGCQRF